MLTQIESNERWQTIRDFLAEHERSEKVRIATAIREAEKERAEAEQMRLAQERAERAEAEQKQIAQERAKRAKRAEAEQKRIAQELERLQARPTTQQGTAFCRYCGNQILTTAAMCMKCGSPIDSLSNGTRNNNSARNPKSRTCYILLAFFLGYFGVHNFYAGYAGRGIVQLLICIFTWWLFFPLIFLLVWILIEMISVREDSDGNPFI